MRRKKQKKYLFPPVNKQHARMLPLAAAGRVVYSAAVAGFRLPYGVMRAVMAAASPFAMVSISMV